MNTKEKIKIMQAYLDGARVRIDGKFTYTYEADGELVWNWDGKSYEIVKETPAGYRLYAAYATAAGAVPMTEEDFVRTSAVNSANWGAVEARIKSGDLKFD